MKTKIKIKMYVVIMSTLTDKPDYARAIGICENWFKNSSYVSNCRGERLLDTLHNIKHGESLDVPDTTSFGNLLSQIQEEDLVVLMKVLLLHIANPNFTLRCGHYEGKTFLQGVIASGNKKLLQLLMSNTHGSETKWKEPLIIDYESAEWLKKERAVVTPMKNVEADSSITSSSILSDPLQIKLDYNPEIVENTIKLLDKELRNVSFDIGKKLFPRHYDIAMPSEELEFISRTILEKCLKIKSSLISIGLLQMKPIENPEVIDTGINRFSKELHKLCFSIGRQLFLDKDQPMTSGEFDFISQTILKECLKKYTR